MQTFFYFRKKLYGGVWEIESDMPYRCISEVPFDKSNTELLNLPFRICHGKKQRDLVYLYGDISIEFLSQNIYDLLSKYGDVSPYLYPIHINDVDDVYYFVHNLPDFKFINRNVYVPNTNYETEIPCFLLQEDLPPLFSLENTFFIIITPEMKAAMIKAKLTNINFKPVFGVSSMEEYYQLQKEDKLRRPKE